MTEPSSDSAPNRTLEMAHVLFVDIVAYSRLPMDQQEQVLLHLQEAVRETKEFVRAKASDQLIRLPTGDGMALVFLGDVEAPVRCALELHRILRRWPEIQLRMGIHTGPVYRVEDINDARNVVGGGINMAQRVMDCGDAGHILLSRNVAEVLEQVRGWSDCLQDLGLHEVKHGAKVQLFNLCKDGLGNQALPARISAVPMSVRLPAKPPGVTPSIAVLPFANLSADKENEYFSDGLAEEILNLLAKIQGLKVIARTSAFAFRDKETDLRNIAERLNVHTILEGSVRRAGNRIRVTAQLINAADESQLWSERYDRELTDIFAIQDEIGQAISEALKVRLAPRAKTVNIEAYQHYLKGQYYHARVTPDSLAKAKECFEQALAIDPNYAPAHSGLAQYYYTLAALDIKPTGDVALLATSAAAKALAIDPANCEAHSVLATMAAICDYAWEVAEKHYRNAMAVESVPPIVRFRYVMLYLFPLRRFADAMEQSRSAFETDPLSMILHYGMAWSMYGAKQLRETIEYARRALEIDANYYLIWFVMGFAQLRSGFAEEGITSFKRVVELAPWFGMGVGSLAAAYCQAGDHERSQEWVRKLADSNGHTLGAAFYYAAAGETDAMFEALDVAHRQRDALLFFIQNLPFFDPYRADPRFQALLQRMNLA
jgi:adenylate cyclase